MRWTTITIMILLLLGCSHSSSPVVPSDSNGSPGGDLTSPDRTVQENGRFLWGLFDVTIDPDSGTVEAIPMRGADFKANVTQFLQPPRGLAGWVSFSNLDFSDFETDGIVRLRVGLTHPFPGLWQYRGFDVMGVFMSDATHHSGVGGGAILPENDGSDARLLNADGYTRWFNPTEFPSEMLFGFVPGIYGTPGFRPSGTVNGYKYFADDLDPDTAIDSFFDVSVNLENRGSFTPGSVNHRDYEIQFPDPGGMLRYQYAIIASWEPPSNPTNPTLDDFSLQANQAEPFLLSADTSDSTVYYVDENDFGGSLHVDLTVYDWQAMEGEGGGIPVPDAIDAIWVESFSDVFMAPVDGLPGATAVPDGPASSTFSFDIEEVNPTGPTVEDLTITVWSAPPCDSYDQGFGAPASSGRLASYILSSVTVGSESPYNQAPSVGAISGETNPMEVDIDDYTVAALDPEGDQLYYGWSLVDDGQPEDWGQSWPDADTIIVDWSGYGVGNYDLYCRVRDDYNPWQYATNSPLDIEVMEFNVIIGTGEYAYWADTLNFGHDGVEAVFLSNGDVIRQYLNTIGTQRNRLVLETVHYGQDWAFYCDAGPDDEDDECSDAWCKTYNVSTYIYQIDTDGTNMVVHMDADHAGTYGEDDGSEEDDVVAFTTQNQPAIVRFIGNLHATYPPSSTAIATTPVPYTVIAMDFDDDGDLWVLDETGDVYELLSSSSYALGSVKFEVDMDTVAPGSTEVFDWAISYLSGDFYIFTDEPDESGNDGGTIHRISGYSGTILQTLHNALSTGDMNPDWGRLSGNRGDIEIDHRLLDGENELAEFCRLVVGGGPGVAGSDDNGAVFVRYDQNLNPLSAWDTDDSASPDYCDLGPSQGGHFNAPSDMSCSFIIFDPIDRPGTEYDHTLWAGDKPGDMGILDCRPAPDDWDGWG